MKVMSSVPESPSVTSGSLTKTSAEAAAVTPTNAATANAIALPSLPGPLRPFTARHYLSPQNLAIDNGHIPSSGVWPPRAPQASLCLTLARRPNYRGWGMTSPGCLGLHRLLFASIGIGLTLGAAPASALTTEDLSGPLTPADLAASLAGPGVTVSNVTFTGADAAGGRFGDGTVAVGFDNGILLSSGAVAGVIGPNQSDGTATSHGTAGDPALSALSGFETFDAAILEFDFVPQAGRIDFNYVFSSEEYNEFANGSVNDVFAFFVNNVNCALVPGTSSAVSINTVNGGNPYGTGAVNPQYFRNNDLEDGGGSIPTEMDGLVTAFTCSATVTPNAVNRMRLGIADGGDSTLDSNVFLQAGSLTSFVCSDGLDNDGDGRTDFPNDPGCVDAADTDEADAVTAPKTLADLPPPEVGRTANVEPVKGEVLVSLPPGASGARAGLAAQKGREFIPLSEARTIPFGSLLDTDSGTVRVLTAAGEQDKTQSGDFFGGLFQLLQERSGREKGLTELSLKGASFRRCRVGSSGRRASAARKRLSRRTVRSLSGNATGRFRTRGRHSAATVRGTVWITSDRCDGTLTKVRRGKVAVRDFRRRRTITLRAGKRYLARAAG